MSLQNIGKIRHSLAHLMAMAILEKFPSAKLGIGPVIENGFYYDFDLPAGALAEAGLSDFEKRIRELIRQDLKFKKEIISPAAAKKLFSKQPYKLELIKELQKSKKPISIYKTFTNIRTSDVPHIGKKNLRTSDVPKLKIEFTDLCAGPHVKSTSEIDPESFRLIKIAGAYWRGSEKNPMLTRIYGAAFATKKELGDHLESLKKAEICDHRATGERLNFFTISEEIGKGLPLWLPKGYAIRRKLEEYIYDLEKRNGYLHVLTPHIAKENLYEKSGHLAHYKDDMYSPIEIDKEKYYLKPMNCPHHHSIYKHQLRSYRELPMRIAEFGTVYRHERSGVLSGLIRVRGFTQNDAHIYTDEENLENEIVSVLKMHKKVFDDFNIKNYWYRLSLPDFENKEKFGDVKNKKMWMKGAEVLKKALNETDHKFTEAGGEASFYGPKIDIQVKDLYGKEDTIATIQIDYYSASRFNLCYIAEDGKEKPAIVVHRAIFGSFDRFFAFLLEQTCGNLPLWLAPVQAKILAISEKQKSYTEEILKQLQENGIEAEMAPTDETLGKRIREAEMEKIPYILIIGEKEKNSGAVSVRSRQGDEGAIKTEKFIERIKKEIELLK